MSTVSFENSQLANIIRYTLLSPLAVVYGLRCSVRGSNHVISLSPADSLVHPPAAQQVLTCRRS